MNRPSAIALCLAAALTAQAVDSPLSSATDYIFYTPPTNAVKGVLVGPEGAHGVMGAEDVVYLREAMNERAAVLSPSGSIAFGEAQVVRRWHFGSWPADATNGTIAVIHSSTNEITGKLLEETNHITRLKQPYFHWGYAPHGVGVSALQDIGNILPPRCATTPFGRQDNFYDPDAALPTAPFVGDEARPIAEQLCQTGGVSSPLPLVIPESTNATFALRLAGPARLSVMTNLYSLVSRHSRAGINAYRMRSDGGMMSYNRRVDDGQQSGRDDPEGPYENVGVPAMPYYFEADAWDEKHSWWYYDYDTHDWTDRVDDRRRGRQHLEHVAEGTPGIITQIPWLYVTTGGVQRLTSGKVFLKCVCSYQQTDSETVETVPRYPYVVSTNVCVIVPVSLSQFTERNGLAAAALSSGFKSIATTALNEAGASVPRPEVIDTSGLSVPEPTKWVEGVDDLDELAPGVYGYYKENAARREVEASVSIHEIFIVIDCTFRTQLQEPQP